MKPTLALVAILALLPVPALSADEPLPGVASDYRIVKPAAEAEPAREPGQPDEDGVVRVGDWEIRISGSVSFEIGTGDSGRRR